MKTYPSTSYNEMLDKTYYSKNENQEVWRVGGILHNTNGAHQWEASIWGTGGTDCRCSDGHGISVPAFYMVHGIPCPRFARFIWGTDIHARVLHTPHGARNSVPNFYMVHMRHGIPCPPYTICIWGTEFRTCVLHGINGALGPSVPLEEYVDKF